jgi:hypothetical protein
MAIYGNFNLLGYQPTEEEKELLDSGKVYKREISAKGNKFLTPIYDYRSGIYVLNEKLKSISTKHNIIIISNFIYVDANNTSERKKSTKDIISRLIDSLNVNNEYRNFFEYFFKLYFLSELDERLKNTSRKDAVDQEYSKILSKDFKSARFGSKAKEGSLEKENENIKKNSKKEIQFYNSPFWPKNEIDKSKDFTKRIGRTEFNEILNFLYFYYKINNYKIAFFNYLLAVFDYEWYSKNITSNFIDLNPPIEVKGGIDLKKLKEQYLNNLLPLLSEKKEYSWFKSAKLTYDQIVRSQIFNTNYSYSFYSEESSYYKKIYNRIHDAIKRSDVFDEYFKSLNINKYFISDVLAVEKRNKNNAIFELIEQFEKESTIENLNKIFIEMDLLFLEKKFIPISLKILEPYTNKSEDLPPKTIEKQEIESSLVKIINPPRKSRITYNKINLDDFDRFLLKIMIEIKSNKNIKNILGKSLKIDYNSFKYFLKNEPSTTYGGLTFKNNHGIYFEFDIILNGKFKTYTFDSSGSSLKIRRKGSASATGEGTINSNAINYITKIIYKGAFNSKIQKLCLNRLKNFPSQTGTIISNYKMLLLKKQIITGSKDYDEKYKKLQEILSKKYKEYEDIVQQNICIDHFVGYYNSITGKKQNIKYPINDKTLGMMLKNICSREIGFLLDKQVSINGQDYTIHLTETEKKQIISSAWGLIAARGPIQFLDENFKNAKELKDLTMYNIKFPALVKIGI